MKKKRKHHPRLRALGHRLEYAALRALLFVLHYLPWPAINLFAHAAAGMHATILPVRRHTILKNLKIALPELPAKERRRIARRMVYHSVLFIGDLAKLQGMAPEKIGARIRNGVVTDAASLNALHELKSAGSGYLLATGHFGNWEWLGAWIVQMLGELAVVYKPLHNPHVDAQMRAVRTAWREGVISTKQRVPRALIQTLRTGSGVAIVADQDARSEGEMLEFFGRPASTATGLASLAVRLQIPFLIGFLIRERPGRFRYVTQAVIHPDPAADPEAETRRLMREYHHALETIIRAHPEQYFWWHNRWKTREIKSKSD